MQYWQIAAGSEGRDYSDYFLQFGMAFVGGETHIITMEQVNEGDIVVLKRGTQEIVAAGRVIKRYGKHQGCDDKEWLRDIDGWDLPAYCYVDWKLPVQSKSKPTYGLTRTTIQGINNERIKNEANEILNSGRENKDPLEPSETKTVKVSEILKCLIEAGLRPSSADELTNAISRIRLLADYYYNSKYGWHHIREHETRTFLVVPLLLALGWAEQQIKIELPCSRGKVDIACFRKNYEEKNDDCVAIIETKGFSSGLDYAEKQAKTYAENFPSCEVLITTNGYCYKIYKKNGASDFETDPSAYMNLLKPKDNYPLDPDNVHGVLDAIKWLLPNSYLVKSQDQG